MVDKFCVFISYGILNGLGVRVRAKFVLSLLFWMLVQTITFLTLRFLAVSRQPSVVVLILSFGFYLLISNRIEAYVGNNWHLFNPRAKEKVRFLAFYRIVVWLMMLGLVLLMSYSGYLYGKALYERENHIAL